jgi:hypothetical protein
MALAPSALAQNAAAADVLFQKGKDAFDAKRYAEACPAFAESYRLDPVSGSLVALASCYEADGKLASAWSRYGELASLAEREGKKERAEAARQRAKDLEPKLARLTITVAPDAAAIQGLVVKRDGTELGAATFGTAIPVDRGEHTIEAAAPGHTPFAQKISIQDGATLSVSVPALTNEGGAAPPPPPPETTTQSSGSPLKTLGWVSIGVGGVAVIVGGVVGGLAIAKKSESDTLGCDASDVCPSAAARQARRDARGMGGASTGLVVAGGIVAAAGIALVIIGGSSSKDSKPSAQLAPSVGPSGGGFAFTGRF